MDHFLGVNRFISEMYKQSFAGDYFKGFKKVNKCKPLSKHY